VVFVESEDQKSHLVTCFLWISSYSFSCCTNKQSAKSQLQSFWHSFIGRTTTGYGLGRMGTGGGYPPRSRLWDGSVANPSRSRILKETGGQKAIWWYHIWGNKTFILGVLPRLCPWLKWARGRQGGLWYLRTQAHSNLATPLVSVLLLQHLYLAPFARDYYIFNVRTWLLVTLRSPSPLTVKFKSQAVCAFLFICKH